MPEKGFPYCDFCKDKSKCGRYDKTKEAFYCRADMSIHQRVIDVFYKEEGEKDDRK